LTNRSAYVPHITGLRGLAILVIMLFHFEVPGFEDVFTGVDIVFVVSGFLMTGSLISEYSRSLNPETRIGRFSLKNFYFRRARRLLPASAIVTVAILVFSWFFNNSARFNQVLGDGISNALFATNLDFAIAGTDYFQFGQQPSPFLHFWSLAVQEQFYFVWPPLMLAVLAYRGLRIRGVLISWQQRLRLLFLVTTIVSLLSMIVMFYFQPTITYFLTLTRVWELSIGALVAIDLRNEDSYIHRLPNWVKQLPIPLFVISLFVVREDNFGYTMPLLIAACVIMVAKGANTKDWDIRFLASKPLTYIGDRSYSLYLWHWPILVFANELGFPDTVEAKLILLAICIAIAIPSYRFIEVPFQKINLPDFKVDVSAPINKIQWATGSAALVVSILLIPSVVVQPGTQAAIASIIPKTQFVPIDTNIPGNIIEEEIASAGWLKVRQDEIRASNEAIAKRGYLTETQTSEISRVLASKTWGGDPSWDCESSRECTLGKTSADVKILAVGSSYTEQYMHTYSSIARSGKSTYVKMFFAASCPNVFDEVIIQNIRPENLIGNCLEMHNSVIDHIEERKGFYDYVVLGDVAMEDQKEYAASAVNFVNRIKLAGLKTVLLGVPPASEKVNECLNKDYSNFATCVNLRKSSRTQFDVASNAGVTFGDISELFCLDRICPLIINDVPTSASSHLTDVSSASIAPYFLDFLRDAKVAPSENDPIEEEWLQVRQAEIRASNDAFSAAGKLSTKQIDEINRVADGKSYGNVGVGWSGSDGRFTLGSPSAKTKILVIGASFAAMYMATFSRILESGESIFVQVYTSGGCPNSLDESIIKKIKTTELQALCRKMHEDALAHVAIRKDYYDFVLLGSPNTWSGAIYADSAVDFTNLMKTAGTKTIILGPPPKDRNLISCFNRDYSNYSSCVPERKSSIVEYSIAAKSEVAFGDVADLFCIERFCPLIIGGAVTSAAEGHLTDASAISIAPYFLNFLRDAKVARN